MLSIDRDGTMPTHIGIGGVVVLVCMPPICARMLSSKSYVLPVSPEKLAARGTL